MSEGEMREGEILESEVDQGEPSSADEIDEEGRNPTQQRMDERGVEERQVDVSWQPGDGEDRPPEPHTED